MKKKMYLYFHTLRANTTIIRRHTQLFIFQMFFCIMTATLITHDTGFDNFQTPSIIRIMMCIMTVKGGPD